MLVVVFKFCIVTWMQLDCFTGTDPVICWKDWAAWIGMLSTTAATTDAAAKCIETSETNVYGSYRRIICFVSSNLTL